MATIARKKSDTARTLYTLVGLMVMAGCVSSDFEGDKKECENQLVGLSPCLNFVVGESRAPPPECCTRLKQDYNHTKKCLCILVKDRNEPKLGLKINATLALSLPSICHVPSNASNCLALLNLAPTSPEAQIFEQFASSPVSTAAPASSSSTVKGKWAGLQSIGLVSLLLGTFIAINRS